MTSDKVYCCFLQKKEVLCSACPTNIYNVKFKFLSHLLIYNSTRGNSSPKVYGWKLLKLHYRKLLQLTFQVNNTSITLAGRNEFKHNHMLCGNILTAGGGAIAALDSNLFIGNTTFPDNNASCSAFRMVLGGGAIFTSGHTVLSFNGISNFINNSADYGGAIFTSGHTVLTFNGISNFINNSADGSDGGGAISTSSWPYYTSLQWNQ